MSNEIEDKAKSFDEIVDILRSIVPTCNNGKDICNDEIVKWIRSARNTITMEFPSIVNQTTQLKNKVDKLYKRFFKDSCGCDH